jgi:hypothetical protein
MERLLGVVCAEDAASNKEAITQGLRVLSAYPIDPAKPCKGFGENTLWIRIGRQKGAGCWKRPAPALRQQCCSADSRDVSERLWQPAPRSPPGPLVWR